MKKIVTLILAAFLINAAMAQNNVGINNPTPHASAALDVTSTTQGILVPRMTAAQRAAIALPANGLLVYQTDATAGFYFYNGTAWASLNGANGTNGQGVPTGGTANQVLAKIDGTNYNTQWVTPATSAAGWGLTGNAVTTNDFLGTTNAQPLSLKVNNQWAGQINNTTSNTSYGLSAYNATSTGTNNTAVGTGVLAYNTTGNENTAFGSGSLLVNTSGQGNTANGRQALINNTTGNFNTAMGTKALYSNSTGFNNTAVGLNALLNSTSNFNTAIGTSSLSANTTGFGNTASGYNALQANTTGTNNIAVGFSTLTTNITGSFITAIGTGANVIADNLTNATVIGNGAIVDASNKVRIGNNAVTAIDVAGQLKVNTNGTSTDFTLPATRGTNNQILTTDGAGATSWATPAAGGANLQLLATKNTSQQLSLAPGSTAHVADVITFQNTSGTLTNGNTWTNNTFTVGTTGAGLYMVTVQLTYDITNAYPLLEMNGGGITNQNNFFGVSTGTPSSILGTNGSTQCSTCRNFRGILTAIIPMVSGDNFRVRAQNSSTAAGTTLSGDNGCKLTVVKMN